MRLALTLLVASLLAVPAFAQQPATLLVEVVDTTGGLLPGASIVLRRGGDVAAQAHANDAGQATLETRPGSYVLEVSADAFETRIEPIQLAAGRSRRVTIELALLGLAETVTVSAEQGSLAEATIDGGQIAALGDDAEALDDFIREVGGVDAEVRVDGFQDGRMPPKEQVAQVIVMSDPYSAQFHGVGQNQVNVITRPGFGEWRRAVHLNLGTDAFAARNPFAHEKLPYRNLDGWMSASGPIKRLRTSVSMDLNLRGRRETLPTIALTPGGFQRGEARSADDRQSFEIRFTNAVGKSAILRNRVEIESSQRFGGLGELDLPERAYTSNSRRVNVRTGMNARLPRGIDQELRAFAAWGTTEQEPLTEAVGINVLGAFRAGGAQTRGRRSDGNANVEGNWTFPARGRHALRAGLFVDRARSSASTVNNYLGTFVFAGLDAFAAGTPITYTQRVGSIDVDVANATAAVYVQDQIRITRTVQAGIGVRQEWQPAIDDGVNLGPRVSLAWAPSKRTTIRGGVGQFYSWHDASLLEEARRLDGTRYYEVVIQQPGYPDPYLGGFAQTAGPGTRMRTADGLVTSRNWRTSVTVERRIGVWNLRATANRQVGRDEPRVRNVNVPVNGVRPDPVLGNVLFLDSVGRSRRTGLEVNANAGNLWRRRLFATVQYSFGEALNDADSALSLPADNFHPEREWGPARNDVRHRAWGSLNLRTRAMHVGVNARWQTALPYNITTGEDTNGDTVANDRPAGVGRNAARGASTWAADLRLGWTQRLRAQPASPRADSQGQGGGNGPEAGVTLAAYNVLNHTQFGSFNGVVTSPLFGHPVSAYNPRRIDLSLHFRF